LFFFLPVATTFFPMGFVGFVVSPGQEYRYTVPDDSNLVLTQAATNSTASTHSTLFVETEGDGVGKIVLCTLHWGKVEQTRLDILFEASRELKFSVDGKGQIHLTGYTIEEELDPEAFGDLSALEGLSEEDEEEEEEIPVQKQKPFQAKKEKNKNQKANSPQESPQSQRANSPQGKGSPQSQRKEFPKNKQQETNKQQNKKQQQNQNKQGKNNNKNKFNNKKNKNK